MNLKNMTLSEVEELTMQVEHLVIQLDRINQYTPQSERIVFRLEKASETFDLSVKHGLNKLEKALFDLDYSKIQKDLADVIRNQVIMIIQSMDRLKEHIRTLENVHKQTDGVLIKSAKLIDMMDTRIDKLIDRTSRVRIIERYLFIAAAGGGVVVGALALYLLSFITWLPQPYFATHEQAVLLQMIKDQTLRIESNTIDTLQVRVDYDTNSNGTNTNIQIGEEK